MIHIRKTNVRFWQMWDLNQLLTNKNVETNPTVHSWGEEQLF